MEIDVLFLGCLHDLGVDRGYTRHPRGAALFHNVEEQRNLWRRGEDQLAANVYAEGCDEGEAIDVEEGEGSEHALGLLAYFGDPRFCHLHVAVQVGVG